MNDLWDSILYINAIIALILITGTFWGFIIFGFKLFLLRFEIFYNKLENKMKDKIK